MGFCSECTELTDNEDDPCLCKGHRGNRGVVQPNPAHAPAPTLQPLDCSICFSTLRSSVPTEALVPCGHTFHTECISPWLSRQDTCPVCRHKVENGNEPQQRQEEVKREDDEEDDSYEEEDDSYEEDEGEVEEEADWRASFESAKEGFDHLYTKAMRNTRLSRADRGHWENLKTFMELIRVD